ncbi:MAG: hypothetical protein P8N94_15840, partial [Gammaproteobacteria bacterium]|nr:hypothetical protein [Gammaproteobacteria bacterium]
MALSPPVNARMERTNQIIATIQQSDFEYLAKPVPCVSMTSSHKNSSVFKVRYQAHRQPYQSSLGR